MLVVTPRPGDTESLMGYILRLTEANGYTTLSYVLDSMHGHFYRNAIGRLDATPLMQIARLTREQVDRPTLRPQKKPKAYIRVYRNDLPIIEVTMARPKVCPQCLAATGQCEAFWDLAQAVACPVHRIMLVTTCPGCESDLTWRRQKVRECKCGQDLTKIAALPATDGLCVLMAVMRHLLYRDKNIAPYPEGMRHLAHLDLRRFCKLLWVLSCTLEKHRGGSPMPKGKSHYFSQYERIALALRDWPRGFQALLVEMYEDLVTTAARLPAFLTLFGWLMIRLIKNDEDEGSEYEFLEREAYRYGAKHWTRGALSRKGVSERLLPDEVRWGTLGEAAEMLGLHLMTVKKLIAAGHIKTRVVSDKKNRTIVVDMDCVRSQKVSRYPAVPIREAAKQVGVSIETLKAMRENGLYVTEHRSTYPGSMAHEDIEVLRARLDGLLAGKLVARGSDVITLDRAFLQWAASPAEKAEVYARLLDCTEWVVGRQTTGIGAGRLQMYVEQFEVLIDEMRGEDASVTAQVAAKRLNCTAAVITELKRTGHLECQEYRGRVMPREKSLRQFERDYEVMSLIAKRVGISVKRVYARVDLSSVRHLRVGTKQCTTVFVHRKNLGKAESLLSAEKAS